MEAMKQSTGIFIVFIAIVSLTLFFFWKKDRLGDMPPPASGDMIIKSSAFKDGETIPPKYTCEGENVNPFLELRGVPAGTKSLALVVDDPDATSGGIWDHWVVWNINPGIQYIEEDTVPQGAVEGKNSFGANRYGGPCPPRYVSPHHYRFKAYALDRTLDLPADSGREALEEEMKGRVIDSATLTGIFGRK